MERQAKLRKLGFALAILGLVVALTAIVPGLFKKDEFPWTLLVGSFLYLHGGLLVVFASRGVDAKQTIGSLRFIRLGFVLVFAVMIWQIVGS